MRSRVRRGLRRPSPRTAFRSVLRLLLVATVGCGNCGGGTTATTHYRRGLDAVGGGGQVGFVSTALPQSMQVKVVTAPCNTQACSGFTREFDAPVTWTASDGSLSAATTRTDAQGIATVVWTLGSSAGPATLVASVPDPLAGQPALTVSFSARAIRHQPRLAVVFGENQVAPPGSQLPLDVFVQLTDTTATGSRSNVAGATVTWVAGPGGATATPSASVTDAQGRTSTTWTLGASSGAQTLIASIPANSAFDAGSITQINIPAVAQLAPARVLRVVSGAAQTGIVGRAQRQPVLVEYVNIAAGTGAVTPVVAAPITFVAANGGSVSTGSATTDAQGRASVTWTLGPGVGAQSLAVSTPTLTGFDAASVYNIAVAGTAEPVTLVLQDNFDVGNQWVVSITQNDFGAWASTRTIVAGGGNSGGFARMVHNTILTTNPTFASVFTRQLYTGGTYNPSIQGAVVGIDYAVDRQTDAGVYDAFVIVQGGVEYRAEFGGGSVFSNASWQTATLTSLQRASFSPAPGPDFSSSGGAMQVGFTRGATQRFAFFTNTHDVDNWRVTIRR